MLFRSLEQVGAVFWMRNADQGQGAFLQALLQLDADRIHRPLPVLDRRDVVAAGVDRDAGNLLDPHAAQRVDLGDRFDLVPEELHPDGALLLVCREDLDDIAADFPDLKIILAHPSFPWDKDGLAVIIHKPNVWMDLSGYSPDYIDPLVVQYAKTIAKDKMLFGSDWPVCQFAAEYAEVAGLVETWIGGVSATAPAKFWGGNAREFYGLTPGEK